MNAPVSRQAAAIPIAIIAGLFVDSGLRAEASFTLLPTGFVQVSGVADNGTVVGVDTNELPQAAQWTKSGGLTPLPPLSAEGGFSSAHGISRDGSIIAGNLHTPVDPLQAVRWISGHPAVGLGVQPGATSSLPAGISDNGAFIVGYSSFGGSRNEAFRWTASSGVVGLGFLPGATFSFSTDVSDNGVVVGTSNGQSFRWTETGGMIGLGYLPGDNVGFASAVSTDGSIVTGFSSSAPGIARPFIWTEGGGMIGLGLLPDTPFSYSTAMTGDGSMIVGDTSFSDDITGKGFIWTKSEGMRSFTDVMSDFGFGSQVAGLADITPTAISADGRYIAGSSAIGEIVGAQSWLFDRGPQGFVPVPESSTYGIVGAAFLAAIAFGRRFGKRRRG